MYIFRSPAINCTTHAQQFRLSQDIPSQLVLDVLKSQAEIFTEDQLIEKVKKTSKKLISLISLNLPLRHPQQKII